MSFERRARKLTESALEGAARAAPRSPRYPHRRMAAPARERRLLHSVVTRL